MLSCCVDFIFPRLFLQLCRSFWVSWSPICQLLGIILVQIESCSENHFLHSIVGGTACVLFLAMSVCFGSLILLELVFVQGDRYGSSFIVCRPSACPALFVEDVIFFSSLGSWHLCQILGDWSHLCLYLDLWFCSLRLHACFCASTTLVLLIWPCNGNYRS